jgi:hypothetical protein
MDELRLQSQFKHVLMPGELPSSETYIAERERKGGICALRDPYL